MEIDPQESFALAHIATALFITGRDEECLAVAQQLRQSSNAPLYVTAATVSRASVLMRRGDFEAVEKAIHEGLSDGADPANMHAIEAALAARTGREREARRLLAELQDSPMLGPYTIVMLSAAAVRLGEPERAVRWLGRKFMRNGGSYHVRLEPDLHPLLDREPFAPRRAPIALVWPLEAPMIHPACHACFREVRIESGIPKGSRLPYLGE